MRQPFHAAVEVRQDLDELAERLRRRGDEVGLAAVGIAPADAMEGTRRILEERKAAGLSGGMQFTYRNPARSTDPGRALEGAAALVVGAWPYGRTSRTSRTVPSASRKAVSFTGGGSAGCSGPDGVRPQGLVARYARRDHYADLRFALGQVAAVLVGAGWRAKVVADDNALVDRAAAQRAGLGWFGKNSNILLPGRGSWFLLGSVITDAPLPPNVPVGDGCGSCRRCLSACPTGALVAPGVLDARKCLAWLLQATGVFPFEYRAALGGRIYGCDDCQDVCPANRAVARMARGDRNRGTGEPDGGLGAAAEARAQAAQEGDAAGEAEVGELAGLGGEGEVGEAEVGELAGLGGEGEVVEAEVAEPEVADEVQVAAEMGVGEAEIGEEVEIGDEADVDLLELLAASDEWLLARYGRWYIPKREPRYLRRNALVALGNVADGGQAAVGETLERYLDHPDDLLRAHAVWAAFRAGRQELVVNRPGLERDPSSIVREELARQRQVLPSPSAKTAG